MAEFALRPFGPEIWTADGPTVRAMGMPFPTRMTVVRLRGGALWVHAPVEIPLQDSNRLAELGTVRFLVAETRMHVWRLEEWAKRFPDAQRWGPPGVKPDERFFTHVLGDEAPDGWFGEIDQMVFRGSWVTEEVYFFHRASRTLLIGDFIQNYPPRGPLFNVLLRAAGIEYGGTPIDVRATFAGNRAAGRTSRDRLLAWDFDRVILAHGACIETGAKAFVERAFRWLG